VPPIDIPVATAISRFIADTLAAIQSDDVFYYTPWGVKRVLSFNTTHLVQGDVDTERVIYLVRPGDERSTVEQSGGGHKEFQDYWVLGAMTHLPSSEDLWQIDDSTEIEEDKQNKIESDVKRAIARAWPQSGIGILTNLEVTDADKLIKITGWAVVQFRVLATYKPRWGA